MSIEKKPNYIKELRLNYPSSSYIGELYLCYADGILEFDVFVKLRDSWDKFRDLGTNHLENPDFEFFHTIVNAYRNKRLLKC